MSCPAAVISDSRALGSSFLFASSGAVVSDGAITAGGFSSEALGMELVRSCDSAEGIIPDVLGVDGRRVVEVDSSSGFDATTFSLSSISKVVMRGSEREATGKMASFSSSALGIESAVMRA